MAKSLRVQLSAKFTGTRRVAAVIKGYREAAAVVLTQGRIEAVLLRRTKERFDTAGSSARAQTGPSGKPWKELAPATLERREGDPKRKLYQTGALRNSVAVVRKSMGRSVLQSASGGGFTIGIKPGTVADDYARIHQFGGYSGRNGKVRIPARRYLGVSKEDAVSVRRMLRREYNKSLAGI